MKTLLSISFCFLLLVLFNNTSGQEGIIRNTADNGQKDFSLKCTPDLNPLVTQWVKQYNKTNPTVKISVFNAQPKDPGVMNGADLGIVSRKGLSQMKTDPDWKIVIGHDVIVPVMNEKNPYLNELLRKGVTKELLSKTLSAPGTLDWGKLTGASANSPIHLYISKDETTKAVLAAYLMVSKIGGEGINLVSGPELVAELQKDPDALGFCKLVDLVEANSQQITAGIKLMPIDKNGNGTIDNMENIYGDLDRFMRGVWIGKYPKALVNSLYAVSTRQPSNQAELDFLKWVISDGQNSLSANGFSALIDNERGSQFVKMNVAESIPTETKTASHFPMTLLVILGLLLIAGIIITKAVRSYRRRSSEIITPGIKPARTFDENALKVPKGLFFDRTHTWAFQERDGNITVGIDDFLQHITGRVTRVVMKNAGDKIRKGDLLFSLVQQGKQLRVYAPVSGTIIKQNELLAADPSILNKSPYADGWVYSIEPTNWLKELQSLDFGEKYKMWLTTEFSRLRDFLAAVLQPRSLEYSHVVLQDGGVIVEGVLNELGPEAWEDFQSYFLDETK